MAFAGPGLPSRDPVGGFFDFGLKGGIDMAPQSAFSPFSGFSSGPGAAGGAMSLPGLGDAGMTYRGGNMMNFDQDNGSIVKQYLSDHTSLDRLREDTGFGQLTFCANRRHLRHLQSLREVKGLKREEPKFGGVKEPLEFKCLSRLNRYLKSRDGRIEFGNDTDCKRLRETWRFAGVLNTQVASSYTSVDEVVLAFIVGKRARIKDLTRLLPRSAQMNDRVFLILRRYRYKGAKLPKPVTRAAQVQAMDQKLAAEGKVPMADVLRKKIIEEDVKFNTRPGQPDKDEYYWQYDIWVGQRNSRPADCLFLTESFTGDIEYIGVVNDLYNDRSNSIKDQANAKEALMPSTDTDEWTRRLIELPDLEIMIRIR